MIDKVILSTGLTPFGGSRIAAGAVSADLWSDGVVLGAAWSMSQREIAGEIFSFRGTLTKSLMFSRKWVLTEDVPGTEGRTYCDHFNTRREALAYVERAVTLKAFRALNAAQAAS